MPRPGSTTIASLSAVRKASRRRENGEGESLGTRPASGAATVGMATGEIFAEKELRKFHPGGRKGSAVRSRSCPDEARVFANAPIGGA